MPYPDLIFLDGGSGHISACLQIMETMDISIPVFGMVKNSRHKTKGLLSPMGEVSLLPTDSIFKLITNIQDEVHRCAITYHRNKRSEALKKSELDEIKGVGKVKKAALLKHFKSIENIKNAGIDELSSVLDKKTARSVYEYFDPKGKR